MQQAVQPFGDASISHILASPLQNDVLFVKVSLYSPFDVAKVVDILEVRIVYSPPPLPPHSPLPPS